MRSVKHRLRMVRSIGFGRRRIGWQSRIADCAFCYTGISCEPLLGISVFSNGLDLAGYKPSCIQDAKILNTENPALRKRFRSKVCATLLDIVQNGGIC